MINLIFAMDLDNNIGIDDKLPWHNPEDLKYFKDKTKGNIIVMGRKTFESLGSKPLPNRHNLVLTNNKNNDELLKSKGAIPIHYVNTVLALAMDSTSDIFIIGGAEIYKAFYDYADNIFMTIMEDNYEANIKFPIRTEQIIKDFELDNFISLNNYSFVLEMRRKSNEANN